MDNHDLLFNILEIKAPWRVLDIRDDLRSQQIDVWIGIEPPKKSWIFGRTPPSQQAREYVWRHANLCALRCVIHASIPDGAQTADLPWYGEADSPFTRTMALQVAGLMASGVPLQHICSLLDIAVEDLWKFRRRIDSGKARLSGVSVEAATEKSAAAAGNVPEPEASVWEALLEGSVNIDIRVLSLKLLLAKMREQMQSIQDKEVRVLKSHELQRYFARNERHLAHELAQLRQH